MGNKKIFITFLIFVSITSFVLAQEQPTEKPIPPFFNPSYGLNPVEIMPWKAEYCNKSGMDFIVMVTPEACEPNPVRSDILEEENVPVMCRLTAIKINPLIQVPYIKSIDLATENKSPEIFNIAFFPARSAFSYYDYSLGKQITELEGFPSMNNIGYLMIYLRRQPIEAKMPNNVTANLQVKIIYDVARTFGISENRMVIRKMTEEEWRKNYKKYSFWNGRGYLRLINLKGTNKAEIALYTSPFSRPIWQGILSEGEQTKEEIKLPYFYCETGPKIMLEKISKPETRARLIVNGNELVLGHNDDILDSGCKISEIVPSAFSHAGKVEIRCFGKTERLIIEESWAELSVKGERKNYSIGEEINVTEDNKEKYYYVGFVGSKSVVLYSGKNIRIKEETREKISRLLYGFYEIYGKEFEDMPSSEIQNKIAEQDKKLKDIVGEIIILKEGIETRGIKLLKAVSHVDAVYSKEAEKAIEDVLEQYQRVAYSYGSIEHPEGSIYGIVAMRKAADFAFSIHKREKAREILGKLIDRYSSSDNPEVLREVEDARRMLTEISFGGGKTTTLLVTPQGNYLVHLLSVERPGIDSIKATLRVNGTTQEVTLEDVIENWRIIKIEEDSVTFLERGTEKKEVVEKGKIVYFNDTRVELLSTEINLEASVVVLPFESKRVTETNFSVVIGIEKRAIQLSPERINSLIKNLNKTIDSLNKINQNLGKMVSTWKKACFVGGTALWIKNFVTGISGESIARRKVMEFWEEFCKDYSKEHKISMSRCYKEKEKEIQQDISLYKEVIKKTNEFIEKVKKSPGVVTKGGIFKLSEFIDESKYMEAAQREFPQELHSLEIRLTCEKAGGIWKEKCNESEEREYNALNFKPEKKCCVKKEVENIRVGNVAQKIKVLYEGGKIYRNQLNDLVADLYLLKICNEKGITSAMCKKAETSAYAAIEPIYDAAKLPSRETLQSNYPSITLFGTPHIYVNLAKISLQEMPVERLNLREITKDEKCPNEIYYYTAGITSRGLTLLLLEATGDNHYTIKGGYVVEENRINCTILYNTTELGVQNMIIVAIDPRECGNHRIKDPEIKFWDRGPYEGLIALMPIIPQSGWYLATQSYTGMEGELTAYKASGEIRTFWICNVGPDGKIDFDFNKGPKGDDKKCCRLISLAAETEKILIPPFDYVGSRDLIERAKECMRNAKQEYDRGKRMINTGKCGTYRLGKPPVSVPTLECEDFMSPSDCHLLYNICDPVICPASRCNLGGNYPTENVIAEGIIGSLVLCLPNFEDGRGVLVPICLTGLYNGLDFLNSILKAYRDCLQEQLNSGRTVGICDEFHSIYVCEFLWHNIGPILKYGIPEITSSLRGGGEYASFSESWKNMIQSLDYFTQVYAPKTIQAFKERSTTQVGKEVCKRFISVVYPSPGKFLEEISKPETYPMAFATLQEIPNTGITPQSHYKVFYIIKAGERGIYYSVYLRSPPERGYYNIPEQYFLPPPATGYLPPGQTISETPDFFAPSGYKEICIRIDGKDYCDFGTVSTSFAVEELQNLYLKSQIKREIKTTKECISGSPTIVPVPTLNLQNLIQESISPAIYKRGVTRVCASRDPDEGTGEDRFRWVGYCDTPEIGCWLDMESVNNTIFDLRIRQDIINYTKEKDYTHAIEALGFYTIEIVEGALQKIKEKIIPLKEKYRSFEERLLQNKERVVKGDPKLKDEIEKTKKESLWEIENLTGELRQLTSKTYHTEKRAEAEMMLAELLELKANFSVLEEKIKYEAKREREIEEKEREKIKFEKFNHWFTDSYKIKAIKNNVVWLTEGKKLYSIGNGKVIKGPYREGLDFPWTVEIQYASNLFVRYVFFGKPNITINSELVGGQGIGSISYSVAVEGIVTMFISEDTNLTEEERVNPFCFFTDEIIEKVKNANPDITFPTKEECDQLIARVTLFAVPRVAPETLQELAEGTIILSEMKKAGYEITQDDLKDYLEKKVPIKDSPFKKEPSKYAEWFMWYGLSYNIDPAFAVAVAAHESVWGTSNLAKNNKNLFGIRERGGYKKYETHEKSIVDFYNLTKEKYIPRGQDTPAEIICMVKEGSEFKYKPELFKNWCYCTEENGRPGCYNWSRNVVRIRKEIIQSFIEKKGVFFALEACAEESEKLLWAANYLKENKKERGFPPGTSNTFCGEYVWNVFRIAKREKELNIDWPKWDPENIISNKIKYCCGEKEKWILNQLRPGDLITFKDPKRDDPSRTHIMIVGPPREINGKIKYIVIDTLYYDKRNVEKDGYVYFPDVLDMENYWKDGTWRDYFQKLHRAIPECIDEAVAREKPKGKCGDQKNEADCKALDKCWWDSVDKVCRSCPENCEGKRSGLLGIDPFARDTPFKNRDDCEKQAKDQCGFDCIFLNGECVDASKVSILKTREVLLVSSVNNEKFTKEDRLVNFQDNVKICAVLNTEAGLFSIDEVANNNNIGIKKWPFNKPEFKWFLVLPEPRAYNGTNVLEGREIITYNQEEIGEDVWCIEAEKKEGTYWYRVEATIGRTTYSSNGTKEQLEGKPNVKCGANGKNYYCGIENVFRVSRKSSHSNPLVANMEAFKNLPFVGVVPFIRENGKDYSLTQLYKGMECNTLVVAAVENAYRISLPREVHDEIEKFIERFGIANANNEKIEKITINDLFGMAIPIFEGDIFFLYNEKINAYAHTLVVYNNTKNSWLEKEDIVIYTSDNCVNRLSSPELTTDGNLCYAQMNRFKGKKATLVRVKK